MDAMKKSRLIGLAISTILPATGALGAPHFVHHDAQSGHEEESHYSDKGEHPTKAQRLGVTLTSRVLLDKAGNADFEITTGKLDSSDTAPGNIDKLEVTALKPGVTKGDDKEAFEKEYNHLRAGGYARYTYKGLGHGQTVKVEAKVSGFGNGHERVEMDLADVVKFRPDFTVQKLDYPTSARPNTVVQINGVVAERMGDLGGHADCVLLVDGVQADIAKGIWVDAASVVTCHFSHRFSSVGTHKVTVRTQSVLPGDYDTSNNELTGEILIKSPANLFYSSSAYDWQSTSSFSYDFYATATSSTPDSHSASNSSSQTQGRSFSGHVPVAVQFPLKTFSYSDSSDGAALTSVSFTDLVADSTLASVDPAYTSESVIQRNDDPTGRWLLIHRYENTNTGAGATTIDLMWMAGVVTYHSESSCSGANGYTCTASDFNYNPPASGTFVKLGSTYAADVVLDDGTAYSAHPSLALTPINQSSSAPMSCYVFNASKSCWSYSSVVLGKMGYAALTE